ncbi:MAG: hypothetical protein OXH31_03415 [Gammaproteobacteria bacterium]|nr:hypothetical protein [Gammaproteobacteria bacterium]
MKRLGKNHWIIVGCTATIVVAVSLIVYLFVISNLGDQDGETSIGSIDPSKTQRIDADSQGKPEYQSPGEAVHELVKIESVFQRSVSLYKYLVNIDKDELIDLLNLTENIERGSIRTSIQTLVVRKLTTYDPDHALRWIADLPRVRRAPLLESVFHEWSLTNLSEAVVGAQSLYGTDQHVALDSILSTRNDISTSTLLDIARELDLEGVALQLLSAHQTFKLIEDPVFAWTELVKDDVDDGKQLDSFKLIASEWNEEEGLDVLFHAAELFPHKNDRTALSAVIEGVVGAQLDEAFDYVQNLSRRERGELPCALAMVAARIDPIAALEKVAKWADDPIHVQLQRTVSDTWAHTDPRGMLDNLELLPQVARVDAIEIAFTHLAYVSPEEALQYLETAKKFLRSAANVVSIIAKQWSNADPEAALEWSISYAGENSQLREILVRQVLRNIVATDIQKALELSRELASTRIHLTQAPYDVVWELTQMGRLDEAIKLLPQLDEHPRYFAIDDLGKMLVRSGDPHAAIALGAEVPSLNAPLVGPASYFNGVFWEWVERDPQQLFDSLPAIESQRLRSWAAKMLLDHQESRPVLSEESVASIETLLSEHPASKNIFILELKLQEDQGLIDLDELVMPDDWRE